jgi:hypothetical protein
MLTTPRREIGAHQSVELERRLAAERLGAFALEREQRALDRADRLRADHAVAASRLSLRCSATNVSSARRSSSRAAAGPVVGELEDDLERPSCVVVQLEDAAEKARPISLMVARTGWPDLP